MIWVGLFAVCFAIGWHLGHGHSNFRHARAAGHRRGPSLTIGARGAWISVPGPAGTRISKRL